MRISHRLLAAVLTAFVFVSAGDSGAQNVPTRRAVVAFRLGGADAQEPFAFGEVPRLAVDSAGVIFARLSSEGVILVLRPDGTFLRKIGRKGEGPGEFQVAGTHGVLGDTLWVTNWPAPRISLFRRDGTHISTRSSAYDTRRRFSAPIGITGLLSARHAYLHVTANPTGVSERIMLPMLIGDSALSDVDTVTLVPSPARMFIPSVATFAYNPTPRPPLVAASTTGRGIAVASWSPSNSAVATVRVVSPAGVELFRRELSLSSQPIPSRYRDSLLAEAMTRAKPALDAARRAGQAGGGNSGRGSGGSAAVAPPLRQNDEELVRQGLGLPTHFPPIKQLTFGSDGTIWLERFGSGQPGNWLVLSPTGEQLFQVQLPASFELQQASAVSVWGTERDALDVPYIIRMNIVPR